MPEADELEFALAEVKSAETWSSRRYLQGRTAGSPFADPYGTQHRRACPKITQLAPTGALANRGDLLFELDDSERVAALEDTPALRWSRLRRT